MTERQQQLLPRLDPLSPLEGEEDEEREEEEEDDDVIVEEGFAGSPPSGDAVDSDRSPTAAPLAADVPMLAISGEYPCLRVFRPDLGAPLFEIGSSIGYAVSMCLFRSQAMLAHAEEPTIGLYNVQTRQRLGQLAGHTNRVVSLVACDGSDLLASGSWDKTVRLWDLWTGEARATLRGHTGYVTNNSLCCVPTRNWVVSGSVDSTIRVWDLHTAGTVSVIQHDRQQLVHCLEWGGDETNVLLSCCSAPFLRLFSVNDGMACVKQFDLPSVGECILAHPDNSHVVFVGHGSGRVSAFDLRQESQPVATSTELHSRWLQGMVAIGRRRFASCDGNDWGVNVGSIQTWNDQLKPGRKMETETANHGLCCLVPMQASRSAYLFEDVMTRSRAESVSERVEAVGRDVRRTHESHVQRVQELGDVTCRCVEGTGEEIRQELGELRQSMHRLQDRVAAMETCQARMEETLKDILRAVDPQRERV